MSEERLQKVMAAAGVASRRMCEKLIVSGRVKVNGVAVRELGTKVDPELVQIVVDGKPIKGVTRNVYYKLYKPRGVLSDSGGDSAGRKTVIDLLPENTRRVFPVGRLDVPSEGLILLTDDGDLAHKLTHPRFQHRKSYFVLVESRPTENALKRLRKGVRLPEGGRSLPADARFLERLPPTLQLGTGRTDGVWLEIVLREGKKRQNPPYDGRGRIADAASGALGHRPPDAGEFGRRKFDNALAARAESASELGEWGNRARP